MMVMGFDEQAQCSTDNDLYVDALYCCTTGFHIHILIYGIYTYTRAYLGRKALSQLVHGRALRISDIVQSVPLMSREIRGTETRYLAVVGTREHGIGNVCEDYGVCVNV